MTIGIVGAGPVGLVLALLLDRYGVSTVVYERESGVATVPRGSTHGARTMEHYRRLGLAREIELLGLPAGHSAGIAFRRQFNGELLADVDWPNAPTAADAWRAGQAFDAPTPERTLRANQNRVEPFLLARARARARITVRTGCAVHDVRDLGDVVQVRFCDETGIERSVRHEYLVGCDGGRSLVRRALGGRLEGADALPHGVLGARSTAAHIRVRGLSGQGRAGGRRWANWVFDGSVAFNLIALDGVDEYSMLTGHLPPGATPSDLRAMIDDNTRGRVDVDVVSMRPWDGGAALVADRFCEGRLFVAGDAAHLFTPHGGFGMNTGLDEAANLAWKLAAVCGGWAQPGVLQTYGQERRPTALANTATAREFARRLSTIPADGADTGRLLEQYALDTIATDHVSLGADYRGSAITATDGGVGGEGGGTRVPHLWLGTGRAEGDSLYDRLGWQLTFLYFGRPGDACAVRAANCARSLGIPLSAVAVPGPAPDSYAGREFALVRPDGHLCWSAPTFIEREFVQGLLVVTGRKSTEN